MIRVDQDSTIPNTDFRNEFFSIDQGGRQTRIIPPIGYSSVIFRRFLETKACNRSLALAVSENLNPSYLTTFSKVVGYKWPHKRAETTLSLHKWHTVFNSTQQTAPSIPTCGTLVTPSGLPVNSFTLYSFNPWIFSFLISRGSVTFFNVFISWIKPLYRPFVNLSKSKNSLRVN